MRALFTKLQMALGSAPQSSKDEAKQRLKLLLIHDQINLTPAQLERMKGEILEVITQYCEVEDAEQVEFKLNRMESSVVLHSLIPVRRVTARA